MRMQQITQIQIKLENLLGQGVSLLMLQGYRRTDLKKPLMHCNRIQQKKIGIDPTTTEVYIS